MNDFEDWLLLRAGKGNDPNMLYHDLRRAGFVVLSPKELEDAFRQAANATVFGSEYGKIDLHNGPCKFADDVKQFAKCFLSKQGAGK